MSKKEGSYTYFKDNDKQRYLPTILISYFEACLESTNSDIKGPKGQVVHHTRIKYKIRIESLVDLGDIPKLYEYTGTQAYVHFAHTLSRSKLNTYLMTRHCVGIIKPV